MPEIVEHGFAMQIVCMLGAQLFFYALKDASMYSLLLNYRLFQSHCNIPRGRSAPVSFLFIALTDLGMLTPWSWMLFKADENGEILMSDMALTVMLTFIFGGLSLVAHLVFVVAILLDRRKILRAKPDIMKGDGVAA